MSFNLKKYSSDKVEFTPLELVEEMNKRTDLRLLDVRELMEIEICKLENAIHIPIGQIIAKMNQLPRDIDLIVYCHMGVRSKQVMQYLRNNGFTRVFNLKGGIDRWSVEVDSKVERY